MMGSTIISPTYRLSCARSLLGIASSMSSLSRYGLTTPMSAVSTMELITTTTATRYGRKKVAIRRMVRDRCSGVSFSSAGSSVLPS